MAGRRPASCCGCCRPSSTRCSGTRGWRPGGWASPGDPGASSLRLRARHSTLPPDFAWTVRWATTTTWKLDPAVELPKDSLQVAVIGHRAQMEEADGSARLLGDRITLAAQGSDFVLHCTGGNAGERLLSLERAAAEGGESLVVASVSGQPIDLLHDARALSATLRAVQGERRELSGFVAADRGWLQLPLPNVAPLDPDSDESLLALGNPQGVSVLDGFLRWSAGVPPTLLSAGPVDRLDLDAIDLVGFAPWALTVEQAGGFELSATLRAAAAGAQLRTWRLDLRAPEISTRGLLWLSCDAPSTDDALPRLGGGPGSFFDLPFEVVPGAQPQGSARFSLARLELDPQKASLVARALSMTNPDGESWAWLRHPRLPLAATMPMTRSGGESAQPSESRDLAPFLVQGKETPLIFGAATLLAETGTFKLTRCQEWPWPVAGQGEPRGVAFAALGVPGAELLPKPNWDQVSIACRYDLPLLDEAFATAKLARRAAESAAAPPPGDPPVTALDRDAIAQLWAERARRQELARVRDSYLLTFDGKGASNLIAPATWDVAAELVPPAAEAPLPYGTVMLEDDAGAIALTGMRRCAASRIASPDPANY